MGPLNVIIIDDETDAGNLLGNLLSEFQTLKVRHIYVDPYKALESVILEQPDVVFSDVEMPRINGIEFLKHVNELSPKTKVVFTTAFETYAIEAIHNDAFDFICKPIAKNELTNVVRKILATVIKEEIKSNEAKDNRVLLKTSEGYHYVSANNVIYIEADGSYSTIILDENRRLLASMNLGRIQEHLPRNEFIRISRKHIINKAYLTFINFTKGHCIVSNNDNEYSLEVNMRMKDIKQEL